jgi:hypothetical protein
MKKNIALFFAIAFLLSGCSWIGGLFTKDINTDLEVDIPVNAVGTKSAPEIAVQYTAHEILDLANNADLEEHLENIKEINLNDVRISVGGLTSGQVVTTLSVKDVTNIIATHSNITPETGLFSPDFVDENNLYKAADKLYENGSIDLTVTGDISGPMAFLVHLTFDATIKVGL